MDIGGLCILPYWAVSLGILGVLDDRVLGGLARGFGLGGCCADLADFSRHLLGTWGPFPLVQPRLHYFRGASIIKSKLSVDNI